MPPGGPGGPAAGEPAEIGPSYAYAPGAAETDAPPVVPAATADAGPGRPRSYGGFGEAFGVRATTGRATMVARADGLPAAASAPRPTSEVEDATRGPAAAGEALVDLEKDAARPLDTGGGFAGPPPRGSWLRGRAPIEITDMKKRLPQPHLRIRRRERRDRRRRDDDDGDRRKRRGLLGRPEERRSRKAGRRREKDPIDLLRRSPHVRMLAGPLIDHAQRVTVSARRETARNDHNAGRERGQAHPCDPFVMRTPAHDRLPFHQSRHQSATATRPKSATHPIRTQSHASRSITLHRRAAPAPLMAREGSPSDRASAPGRSRANFSEDSARTLPDHDRGSSPRRNRGSSPRPRTGIESARPRAARAQARRTSPTPHVDARSARRARRRPK